METFFFLIFFFNSILLKLYFPQFLEFGNNILVLGLILAILGQLLFVVFGVLLKQELFLVLLLPVAREKGSALSLLLALQFCLESLLGQLGLIVALKCSGLTRIVFLKGDQVL